jgi:hypothetical protein
VFAALFIAIFVGAALALVGSVVALRAYLSFRRARIEFQKNVAGEVVRLSARTSELERGVNDLSERASVLPVKIAELQNSVAVLQTLTTSLAATLRQAQRVLTFSGMKAVSSSALGDALRPIFERFGRA